VTLVVDASVAIKWIVEEDGHEEAVRVSRAERVVAPDFAAVEAANILWRKVRLKELDATQAKAGLRFIRDAYAEFVPTGELLDRALSIALSIDHPVYDCLYLACAERMECSVLTADRRLAAKRPALVAPQILELGQK
jgi:predicted nucleic acid-binding protein